VFVVHRIKVIDRFKITGEKFLRRFVDFFLHTIDKRLHFHGLLHGAIEPIHPGGVRAKIES